MLRLTQSPYIRPVSQSHHWIALAKQLTLFKNSANEEDKHDAALKILNSSEFSLRFDRQSLSLAMYEIATASQSVFSIKACVSADVNCARDNIFLFNPTVNLSIDTTFMDAMISFSIDKLREQYKPPITTSRQCTMLLDPPNLVELPKGNLIEKGSIKKSPFSSGFLTEIMIAIDEVDSMLSSKIEKSELMQLSEIDKLSLVLATEIDQLHTTASSVIQTSRRILSCEGIDYDPNDISLYHIVTKLNSVQLSITNELTSIQTLVYKELDLMRTLVKQLAKLVRLSVTDRLDLVRLSITKSDPAQKEDTVWSITNRSLKEIKSSVDFQSDLRLRMNENRLRFIKSSAYEKIDSARSFIGKQLNSISTLVDQFTCKQSNSKPQSKKTAPRLIHASNICELVISAIWLVLTK